MIPTYSFSAYRSSGIRWPAGHSKRRARNTRSDRVSRDLDRVALPTLGGSDQSRDAAGDLKRNCAAQAPLSPGQL
jgi:hypothetical protein